MAAETKLQKGLQVHCPFCGEEDSLRINVGDVHNLTCSGVIARKSCNTCRGGWEMKRKWREGGNIFMNV